MITSAEEALQLQREQNMPRLAIEFADRPGDLAAFLEKRFANYLPIVQSPGRGEVADAKTWFPSSFKQWTGAVVGVSELYSEGRGALGDDPDMPGLVVIGWRAHYQSLTRPNQGGVWKDGRQEARDICRPVADAFRKALFADRWLEARVERVSIGRAEVGDQDRMGNPYEDLSSRGNSIIWVHSLPVEIRL